MHASHRYSVDRWGVDEGLPNNALTGLMAGRDGYLWIGSLAGPARFDGERFTPIPLGALPNDHVRVFLEDRRGRLWVGFVGGLARSRPGGFDVYTPSQLAGSDVRTLVEDADGRIWAGTESGISVIDGSRITNLKKENGLPGNAISSIVRGTGGSSRNVWIASEGGLCEAAFPKLRCAPPLQLGDGRVLRGVVQESVVREGVLLQDREGRLWVGGSGGLHSMDAQFKPTPPCAAACFKGRSVTALRESRKGELWAGFGDGGVALMDHGTVEEYGATDGLIAGPVVSLQDDREGSVWVSVYNGGLARMRPKRVRMFTTADGLPARVVGSIVQDRDGTIWAGSQCGPVSELQGERFVPRFQKETKSLCTLALWAARDGSLWIGTDGGLFRWRNGRMDHFGLESGLSDINVRALLEDRDGVLWIGTLHGGLHSFKDGRLSRAYGAADGVSGSQLENFAQDREGRVWIASNGEGLSVFEGGRFRTLRAGEAPPDGNITGLFVDRRGDLWVLTSSTGLYRRRHNRWEAFGPEQGVGDKFVAGILEDAKGTIWVSHARGISRLERERIDAVASGRAASLDPIVIDKTDGMLNPEVSGGGFDPTGLRDREGRLWFSTIDGIAVVDPAEFRPNPVEPKVVIESATIAGKPVAGLGDTIHLPAGGPELDVIYTGLSFIAPKKVRFRYRLHGFDPGWTEAGNRRTAYYPHLPPGDYVFEVVAANNDGLWSRTPATIRVVVAPFWWERRSVRAAGLLALLLATGFGVRAISLRRAAARVAELEREQAIERERRRIARDLHDDIGARLTRVAMMAENPSAGSGRLATAARETIQAMDELVWTVNARNDTVEAFVNYAVAYAEEFLHGTNIRLRLRVPPEIDPLYMPADTRRQIFLAYKEALNNAVKHSGASEVHLSITVLGRELHIELRDDGRGFDSEARKRAGEGLAGMRERVEAAGGRFELQSSAETGTRVHIHALLAS